MNTHDAYTITVSDDCSLSATLTDKELVVLPSQSPPIANARCVGANYTHEVAADVSEQGCDGGRSKLAAARTVG